MINSGPLVRRAGLALDQFRHGNGGDLAAILRPVILAATAAEVLRHSAIEHVGESMVAGPGTLVPHPGPGRGPSARPLNHHPARFREVRPRGAVQIRPSRGPPTEAAPMPRHEVQMRVDARARRAGPAPEGRGPGGRGRDVPGVRAIGQGRREAVLGSAVALIKERSLAPR